MSKEEAIADIIRATIDRGKLDNKSSVKTAKCIVEIIIEVEKNHRHHLNIDLWENVKLELESYEK